MCNVKLNVLIIFKEYLNYVMFYRNTSKKKLRKQVIYETLKFKKILRELWNTKLYWILMVIVL